MKRRDEVLVGLFTTVALIVGIVGAIWFTRGGLRAGYPLYSKFPWGANLKQGQPVLLVGVNVGYVDNVLLKQDGTLITEYRINDEYQVPLGTTATIIPNGIFGDMAIALTPATPNPRSYQEGDTIPVGESAVGLATLTARLDTITRSVKVMIDSTQHQLLDDGGVREVRRTIALMNKLLVQFSEVMAVQSRDLTATQASFRRTLSAVDSAVVDSTIRGVRAATQSFTSLADSLRATNARVQSILAKADSGDGSIAKLLNDRGALLDDFRRLAARTDSLLLDIKANPRKYINLRVF